MAEYDDNLYKINKWIKRLESTSDETKICSILKHLKHINMTVELLSHTGVGKVVNRLLDNKIYGNKAKLLIQKWQVIARKNGIKARRKHQSSDSEEQHDEVDGKDENSHPHNRSALFKAKVSREMQNSTSPSSTSLKPSPEPSRKGLSDYVLSSSGGTSFADALAQADAIRQPKLKKVTQTSQSDLMQPDALLSSLQYYAETIDRDFVPLKPNVLPQRTPNSDLDSAMFKRKDQRRIYAGRRRKEFEVHSLQKCCIKAIGAHRKLLLQPHEGKLPFELVSSILERFTAKELETFEYLNPEMAEDTDKLWLTILQKRFAHPGLPGNDETCHDFYQRLVFENEEKLKSVTSKISKNSREHAAPVKTALLAEAKPPKNVHRAQMRNGLIQSKLPSALDISRARKAVAEHGNKNELLKLTSSFHPTSSHSAQQRNTQPCSNQKKRGPMMEKVLKMMKNTKFHRR